MQQKNVKFCYFCPRVTKPGYKQTCEELISLQQYNLF